MAKIPELLLIFLNIVKIQMIMVYFYVWTLQKRLIRSNVKNFAKNQKDTATKMYTQFPIGLNQQYGPYALSGTDLSSVILSQIK